MLKVVSGDFRMSLRTDAVVKGLNIWFRNGSKSESRAASDVASWKVVSDGTRKRSAIGRFALATVGSAVLGPAGLVAAAASGRRRETVFALSFKDGTRATIEADGGGHDALMGFLFYASASGGDAPERTVGLHDSAVEEPLPPNLARALEKAIAALNQTAAVDADAAQIAAAEAVSKARPSFGRRQR